METHRMVGHLIRRLHQISTHVFARRVQEAGFDLTPVQYAALDAIISDPGIDQAGVAAQIAYDRATIGGVIDRLEQKGYVERTVCLSDRRAREVRPTDSGRQAFNEISPIVAALQKDILGDLDEAERAEFHALAAKAIATADIR
ncbi:MarR family winged helix-turn-helix transcriptional regulator [Oricola sp.]|uniref:MarR family winged helix-turn-helix transcriptional regulator n=1 Tax=Oricola sp. TaxID=1979950 RepID=UPI000C938F36|nr:MarR family transcriptional regulator [Ahrensia sp.]|tara:strand:- start:32931 stop:33362 length:432 start_codon:yes stop_codon:yes gene_type:complete